MTYVCEECKGTFGEAWDGAEKEFTEKFPGTEMDDVVRVCDDCYKKLMARWKVMQS